ncbi:MAG: hypothetical protein AABY07_08865 [Nanoarchaeota archaeon]
MEYKEPKVFGKDEDGEYLGKIEQIGKGLLSKKDTLYISNRRPNLWILSVFNGYKQIGIFETNKSTTFNEGDLVIVTKKGEKIINVVKDEK